MYTILNEFQVSTNPSLNLDRCIERIGNSKTCTAYELDGELNLPLSSKLERVEPAAKPIYEELLGWSEDITGCKTLAEPPEKRT